MSRIDELARQIAFLIPRRLAIFIAQALSHDHFAERSNMTWAVAG